MSTNGPAADGTVITATVAFTVLTNCVTVLQGGVPVGAASRWRTTIHRHTCTA